MPRKYIRKVGVKPRGEWSQEALIAALNEMSKGVLGSNAISRKYGIPSRTLRRRFVNKNTEKLTLGKRPLLDFRNEKLLAIHIQKLERAGFPLSRDMIRRLAFEFAEKLGIETKFDKETRKAGPDWLKSFLERNSELNLHQDEGVSAAKAHELNTEESDKMFEILVKVMKEYDLLDKPDRVNNVESIWIEAENAPIEEETAPIEEETTAFEEETSVIEEETAAIEEETAAIEAEVLIKEETTQIKEEIELSVPTTSERKVHSNW